MYGAGSPHSLNVCDVSSQRMQHLSNGVSMVRSTDATMPFVVSVAMTRYMHVPKSACGSEHVVPPLGSPDAMRCVVPSWLTLYTASTVSSRYTGSSFSSSNHTHTGWTSTRIESACHSNDAFGDTMPPSSSTENVTGSETERSPASVAHSAVTV